MSHQDYQKLASSFLDMWQEQIARSLTDRDFIQKMMQLMQQQPANSRGTSAGGRNEQTHRNTAAASGAEPGELYDLRQRLSACERRIRTLEAALAAKPKPKKASKAVPAKKPAKKGSSTGGRAGASGKAATKPVARSRPKAVKRTPAKPTRKRRLS